MVTDEEEIERVDSFDQFEARIDTNGKTPKIKRELAAITLECELKKCKSRKDISLKGNILQEGGVLIDK